MTTVTTWLGGYLALLVAIALVDWQLGATAEYLNAYEVVRRTWAPCWPEAAQQFVWGESRWGRNALLVAWAAFLVEGLLAELLLYGGRRLLPPRRGLGRGWLAFLAPAAREGAAEPSRGGCGLPRRCDCCDRTLRLR